MTIGVERQYDFRVLELGRIDPPPVAMREAMDPEKLEELKASIRAKGVVSPLGVYVAGDRFTIIYGHRRYIAARAIGERVVPCRVHADGSAREEDYKFTENYYREDVNPAEEATWFADLLERKHAGNIEALCAELSLKESFIQGRLDLLRGDAAVLQALRERRIVLGVARELNKIHDEGWRRHYLTDALEQGANSTTVRTWRMNFERYQTQQDLVARGAVPDVAPSSEAPLGTLDACLICGRTVGQHVMTYVKVHNDCLSVHQRNQEEPHGAAS